MSLDIEPNELMWEYHKLHQKIYEEQELNCLSGLNNEFKLQGKELLMWHHAATRKCSIKYNRYSDFIKNFEDLLYCSEELLSIVASLYLYRPYINNPLKDAYAFGERLIYPNFQNHYSKRYGMFANIASQSVYNFWDRIGDMIAYFFPDKIQPSKIFFPTALDTVNKEFRTSENYIWLDNFRKTHYKELNEKRKLIVHYTTTDTTYKFEHLDKGVNNRDEMQKIQAARETLPDYYKFHISMTLEGTAKTLSLLEEISNTLFADIE